MPSEKFARVFASLALACACKASNSRFFAFSSPDLCNIVSLECFRLRQICQLTFAPAAPDSCPLGLDCMLTTVDRSYNLASPRWWRRWTIHIRCQHSCSMRKRTLPRLTRKRIQVSPVGMPKVDCTLMCFDCDEQCKADVVPFPERSQVKSLWAADIDTDSKVMRQTW